MPGPVQKSPRFICRESGKNQRIRVSVQSKRGVKASLSGIIIAKNNKMLTRPQHGSCRPVVTVSIAQVVRDGDSIHRNWNFRDVAHLDPVGRSPGLAEEAAIIKRDAP